MKSLLYSNILTKNQILLSKTKHSCITFLWKIKNFFHQNGKLRTSIFLLLSIFSLSICFYIDLPLQRRLPFLSYKSRMLWNLFSFLGSPTLHGIGWLIGAITIKRERKQFGIITGMVWITSLLSGAGKIVIGRARPNPLFIVSEVKFFPLHFSDHFHSFPSQHAAVAFGVAYLLNILYHSCFLSFLMQFLWYGVAFLIAISRLFLHRHYLTDVMGGAFLGIIVAKLSCVIFPILIQKIFIKEQ